MASDMAGTRVETFAVDLSQPDGPRALTTAIDQTGRSVDLLVNNAGAGLHGRFAETPLARERELVALNVAAVLELTKHFLPGMVARGNGRIVNVASVAAFLPGPYQSVYYASKAFVLSFSEALAEELRGTGVGVTAVCPGPTRTGFQAAAGVRRDRPLPRGMYLSPEAVADATYRGVLKGRRIVVPGWRNRLLVLGMQLAPRRLVAARSERAARPADGPPRGG